MTAVRHTTEVMARAMHLSEAGWAMSEIPALLEREFGVRPSRDTVHRWVSPAYAERSRRRMEKVNAQRWAGLWRFNLLERSTPACREAFIRHLDAQDLSANSIAKVCSVLFGERVTRYRVVKILEGVSA